MSPEKQRVAIATACGWTIANSENDRADFLYWAPPGCVSKPNEIWLGEPPNYLADLNACHEMEEWLKKDDRHGFACYASELFSEHGSDAVHVTAAQRSEAFLRTLGLWEEDAQ